MTGSANISNAPLTVSHGPAKCPRCGYDLRGAIATWTEQCPLHGTCAGCGLQFAWPAFPDFLLAVF